MKINRFLALALIAVLVVVAMGNFASVGHASSLTGQIRQTSDCAVEDDDAEESQTELDTDDVEDQCGPQGEADLDADSEQGCDVEDDDALESETSTEPENDTDNVNEQCGSQVED